MTRKTIIFLISLFSLILTQQPTLWATTQDIYVTPSGDAVQFCYRSIGNPPPIWSWYGDANPNEVSVFSSNGVETIKKTYLQFAIQGLGSGQDLQTATLSFYLREVWGAGQGAISLYHVADASGATGDATQGLTGWEAVLTNIEENHGGWVTADVTNFLRQDLLNHYSYSAYHLDLDFIASSGPLDFGVTLGSAEGNSGPYLKVTAVPLPSTVLLLGSGLLSLLGWRRFRKS